MITEKIVISDTNILLDLLSQNMLDAFFSLPCGICTTDLVIDEIVQPAQQKMNVKNEFLPGEIVETPPF